MNSSPTTDLHPVVGAPEQVDLNWNEQLTQFYKQHSDSARFLFKIGATFAFITATISLLALMA
ncbi:MAG TPA: hypothetical protein VF509_08970 [Sphingobium sp.]